MSMQRPSTTLPFRDRERTDDRTRAADDRARIAEERSRQYEDRCKLLEERRRQYEERNRALEEKCRSAEEKCRQHEERSRSFEDRIRILEDKNRTLTSQVQTMQVRLRAREGEVRAREDEVIMRDNEIQRLEDDIRLRDSDIRTRDGELTKLQLELQAARRATEKREAELARHSSGGGSVSSFNSSRGAAVGPSTGLSRSGGDPVVKLEATIRALEIRLKARDKEIREMKSVSSIPDQGRHLRKRSATISERRPTSPVPVPVEKDGDHLEDLRRRASASPLVQRSGPASATSTPSKPHSRHASLDFRGTSASGSGTRFVSNPVPPTSSSPIQVPQSTHAVATIAGTPSSMIPENDAERKGSFSSLHSATSASGASDTSDSETTASSQASSEASGSRRSSKVPATNGSHAAAEEKELTIRDLDRRTSVSSIRSTGGASTRRESTSGEGIPRDISISTNVGRTLAPDPISREESLTTPTVARVSGGLPTNQDAQQRIPAPPPLLIPTKSNTIPLPTPTRTERSMASSSNHSLANSKSYSSLASNSSMSTAPTSVPSRPASAFAPGPPKTTAATKPYNHTLSESLANQRAAATFLTRTDAWSGAQVIQAVQDLNGLVVQFAACASEVCVFTTREVRSPTSPITARSTSGGKNQSTTGRPSGGSGAKGGRAYNDTLQRLGPALTSILATSDHSNDPILVQLALQALVCVAAQKAWESFCLGLPGKSDGVLSVVFTSVREGEPQPASAKWRSLTHSHIHSIYPTLAQYSADQLADTILRWTYDILLVGGCERVSIEPPSPVDPGGFGFNPRITTTPTTLPLSPQTLLQRTTLLQQLKHITSTMTMLEKVLRQDILSTNFELVVPQWGGNWVAGEMVDAFASAYRMGKPANEQGLDSNKQGSSRVLGCIEIGLACKTRIGVRGPPPSPISPTTSQDGGLLSNGVRGQQNGQTNGTTDDMVGQAIYEERLLLLPKVVLDSVVDLL